MSKRKQWRTAMEVLSCLDYVVKPFTTYSATFGKERDGTCFFSTAQYDGRGKTFAEALVDWSTIKPAKPKKKSAQLATGYRFVTKPKASKKVRGTRP